MNAAPLIALQQVSLGFGGKPLFQGLDLLLFRGERACLVGRNGSGKSTLLQVLAGLVEPDAGERVVQAGVRLSYLPQEPTLPPEQTVAEYIAEGLPPGAESESYRVDALVDRFDLDPAAALGTLSGGEARRAALARALVGEPEVLLLDEPTNHLDLPTIQWLEDELTRFRGALLTISHDRAFLTRVGNRVFWLDRGQVHRLDAGFERFDDWAEEIRHAEAQELYRLGKQIEREEHWLHRGVTARRKRNQGRLARLQTLRKERGEMLRNRQGQASMAAAEAATSGKLVIEAEGVSKAFTAPDGSRLPIVENFSTRIRRGDRVGIVGRNGAGKTTLINLLLGRLEPDEGQVTLGTNLEIEVVDQKRSVLDPEATPWSVLCPAGGDNVMVGGKPKHVVGYLREFLFEEIQAQQPVKALSGGERNRLLLARAFAQPSNLMVLDEPTNDLDMDTLDLLAEVLDDYQGTLILVSHDRDFLDRLCTSVILLDGRGGAREYPGGFSDAVRQAGGLPDARTSSTPTSSRSRPARRPAAPRPSGKLSYKEQRELDGLPGEMDKLSAQVAAQEAKLADPGLYARDPAGFETASARLADLQARLAQAEERWLELEEKRERLAGEGGA
ncbi:ABC-F family ATP-binding cassette domain-containing protein [Aquibaculum arenosum]|uniref:ATP-binding protein Uup n=1 Tax=Aquibaculum arenosum TaxID=3032591 RepID=A0ABT5YQR2_9PROT|nr:ATP-binding cassette domain-containing protein [Fodinicurvata sp. CAU 1616]MDF2097229.1 ATP-binding cassette domain-containing protein [Fodinicurvata sp. CAU 1616]